MPWQEPFLLATCERQRTFPGNHLEPPLLVLGADISAINAGGKRTIGDGQAAPLGRTAVNTRPLFLPQRLLQAFGNLEDMLPNRARGERFINL
jgi:hypothetical protein